MTLLTSVTLKVISEKRQYCINAWTHKENVYYFSADAVRFWWAKGYKMFIHEYLIKLGQTKAY